MKAWFWCPCCQRAFQGEVPDARKSARHEWLSSVGVSMAFTVECPFDDCRATVRCVMSWPTVRKWAEIAFGAALPAVPVEGRAYAVPPEEDLDEAEAVPACGEREAAPDADLDEIGAVSAREERADE